MTQCQPASRNATGLLLHGHTDLTRTHRPTSLSFWNTRNISRTDAIPLLSQKKYISSTYSEAKRASKTQPITKVCLSYNVQSLQNAHLHKYFILFLNRRSWKSLKTSIYFCPTFPLLFKTTLIFPLFPSRSLAVSAKRISEIVLDLNKF